MTEPEVDAFLESYAEAFLARDPGRIASHFNVPSLGIRHGTVFHLADEHEARLHGRLLIDLYESHGAARVRAERGGVVRLGGWAALVTARWTLQDERGGDVLDFSTTYQLLRTDAGPRIVSYTIHD